MYDTTRSRFFSHYFFDLTVGQKRNQILTSVTTTERSFLIKTFHFINGDILIARNKNS